MKKMLKKVVSATLAVASVFSAAAMFTGCTSNRPEIEMKISFGDKTYTLEYTLYRKLAPKTVEHFLALVEGKDKKSYFDGLCVHNYTAAKWYTGGYAYKDGALEYKEYYDIVKTYNNFPTSVYQIDGTTPTYTVYGEFSKNNFTVESGALGETFGSLSMYYTDKSKFDANVYVTRNDGEGQSKKDYKYNSATSLFYINMDSGSTVNSEYCTFATLNEDSVDELQALKDAVDTYISETYGTDDEAKEQFITETDVYVDQDDFVVGEADGQLVTYDVPNQPIQIVSVKVTKY